MTASSESRTTTRAPRPWCAEMGGSLTPRFKLIFVTVVVLTVIFIAGGAWVSLQPTQTDQTKELIATLLTLGKAGAGAIFGLLGGKSL
jgi:hypothetical protein